MRTLLHGLRPDRDAPHDDRADWLRVIDEAADLGVGLAQFDCNPNKYRPTGRKK